MFAGLPAKDELGKGAAIMLPDAVKSREVVP